MLQLIAIIFILFLLYYIIKSAVRDGLKEAYRDISDGTTKSEAIQKAEKPDSRTH